MKIHKNYFQKFKDKFFPAAYGYYHWNIADDKWYHEIHDLNYLLHENFIEFFKQKENIKTVLEVGCGTGVYPIKYKNLFAEKKYTGIDFSKNNIEFCKKNSNFEFLCGDIIELNLDKKYDLVFSHAVIDHVYDIDKFISKIVKAIKKYGYINSYRGYFPEMKKHKMNWHDGDGCYYNDLSVKQLQKTLLKNGLTENEFQIRPQKSGQKDKNVDVQTVIEIIKK